MNQEQLNTYPSLKHVITRLFCLNRQFYIERLTLTLIASEAIYFCIYLQNLKLLYSIQ